MNKLKTMKLNVYYKIAKYFIILSIQFIIIICLLEIGLRILEPYNHNLRVLLFNPSFLGEYEQINTLEALLNTRPRGFKPFAKRAGFVLNSRSFRTKEYSGGKPQGYYRILAIEDSFTAGWGPSFSTLGCVIRKVSKINGIR